MELEKRIESVQEVLDSGRNKSEKIRILYGLGFRQSSIAKMVEVIPQFVSNVVNRKLKK